MRSSVGSVSNYLGQLKDGNALAIQQIWDRYFEALIRLARGKLTVAPRMKSYDEDVALSAFASFCRAVERGRFPDLRDRTDLWQILVMLTHRKAGGLIRHERRAKHGGGRIRVAADWQGAENAEAARSRVFTVGHVCRSRVTNRCTCWSMPQLPSMLLGHKRAHNG